MFYNGRWRIVTCAPMCGVLPHWRLRGAVSHLLSCRPSGQLNSEFGTLQCDVASLGNWFRRFEGTCRLPLQAVLDTLSCSALISVQCWCRDVSPPDRSDEAWVHVQRLAIGWAVTIWRRQKTSRVNLFHPHLSFLFAFTIFPFLFAESVYSRGRN
jgi:hypothetical protein